MTASGQPLDISICGPQWLKKHSPAQGLPWVYPISANFVQLVQLRSHPCQEKAANRGRGRARVRLEARPRGELRPKRARLRPNRGFPRGLAQECHPRWNWSANRPSDSCGFTPHGRMTREAPVRTEPHPTTALPCPRRHPRWNGRPIDPAIRAGSRRTAG
jgi:hypothetical protein